jgi:hypothetical protein
MQPPSDQQQLDLFASAHVIGIIAFPLHRRAAAVRAAAAKLLALPKPSRQGAWSRIVKEHRRQLAQLGLGSDDIEFEISQFWTAVRCEGTRRRVLGIGDGRGAA